MSISDRFSGLDMGKLISVPLKAVAETQKQLAESAEKFIRQVGFDRNGEVKTVQLENQRKNANGDEAGNSDKMKV